MINTVISLAEASKDTLISIRHHLHAHPELSYEEYATANFVCNELDKIGIEYQRGIAGTGIVALIKGKNPDKKCIALRADMDALPIDEKNDVSYRSKNAGVMHACGHDVHTTCLLGAAIILNEIKDNIEGNIKLIFQPGEEKNPGGAKLLIDAGVLENPKPEAIVALHVYPDLPAGAAGFKSGMYMASADEIYITIKGKGGHAALPHFTVDPIAIAAQVIVSLQQIVSRKINALIPCVLSFGKISGGDATNIIPSEVELLGTLRTFDEAARKQALQLINNITTQIAESFGGHAIVTIPEGYPSLYNNPDLTEQVKNAASAYLGDNNIHALDLRMTAEDFSFYTQQIPGCFFRIGTNKNNQEFLSPVHTAIFDINEEALPVGAGLMAWIGYSLMQ